MARRLFLLAVLLLSVVQSTPAQYPVEAPEGCTIGVAAGTATPDGRPLLWKNRDTDFKENRIVRYVDADLDYLALVTADYDKLAWAGTNEAGFCLLNAYSPDLRGKSKTGPGNGSLLKLALGTCPSVQAFEELLIRTNATGRQTLGSFGVIDALGEAAMFEVTNTSFVRFDAKDKNVAPDGWIVRTNFAFTGNDEETRAKSIVRFDRGEALCAEAMKGSDLTPRHLLRTFCRDLSDPAGTPYRLGQEGSSMAVDTRTCINRSSTAAGVAFHGVLPMEDVRLTTFWAILGEPIFSIAVPSWVAAGDVAPSLKGERKSPLCTAVVDLRDQNYEDHKELVDKDGDPIPVLQTRALQEIWSRTFATEDRIFASEQLLMSSWREVSPDAAEMLAASELYAAQAYATLRRLALESEAQPALLEVSK